MAASKNERLAEGLEALADILREDEPMAELPCPKLDDAEKTDAPAHVLDPEQYTLSFVDNFNTSTLDCNKWSTSFIWTRDSQQQFGQHLTINGEQQFYVDVCQGEDQLYGSPFDQSTGNLIISANSQAGLPETINGELGGQPIRSGIITTYDSFRFRYGYVEVCAKLPRQCGSWPAFWLLHDDYVTIPGNIAEIDFLELPISCDPNASAINAYTAQTAYHYTDQFGTKWDIDGWQVRKDGQFDSRFFGRCDDVVDPAAFGPAGLTVGTTGANAIGHVRLADNSDWGLDFHTWGVEWCPGRLIYYVDGTPVASVCEGSAGQTIYDANMYLIINFAVGGFFPGDVPDPSNFNDQLEVEYAKIWTKN